MFIRAIRRDARALDAILDFSEHKGEERGKEGRGKRCYRFTRPKYVACVGLRRPEVRRRNKTGVECPEADRISFIVIVISWRGAVFGALHATGGITYRWLFVRTSPWVIICLVTRPLTAYLPSFPFHPLPTPSCHCPFVSNRVYFDIVSSNLRKVRLRDACSL